MKKRIPHLVQYQGSKRKLAPQILQYMPPYIERLVEPFAGTAAISIAVASSCRADRFYLNDLNEPLINTLQEAVENPERLLSDYSVLWNGQFKYTDGHLKHYYDVRDRFNSGERTPANMFYLLTRCVKGAIRYDQYGRFNQSPDKRRYGIHPKNLEANVLAISKLLTGKTEFSALDYREVIERAEPGDLVYLDPPYQGVSRCRDNRYLSGVSFEEFSKSLELLESKEIDFIVSYDGRGGDISYGRDLPEYLGCRKIMLNAGLSSQAILLGKKSITFEALYLSKNLTSRFNSLPEQ